MFVMHLQRADLGIVLEYAYRGVAAQGGKKSCHNQREVGCALCDALTAAEEELKRDPHGEYLLDREWWVRPWYQALWGKIEYRIMRAWWWLRS